MNYERQKAKFIERAVGGYDSPALREQAGRRFDHYHKQYEAFEINAAPYVEGALKIVLTLLLADFAMYWVWQMSNQVPQTNLYLGMFTHWVINLF